MVTKKQLNKIKDLIDKDDEVFVKALRDVKSNPKMYVFHSFIDEILKRDDLPNVNKFFTVANRIQSTSYLLQDIIRENRFTKNKLGLGGVTRVDIEDEEFLKFYLDYLNKKVYDSNNK